MATPRPLRLARPRWFWLAVRHRSDRASARSYAKLHKPYSGRAEHLHTTPPARGPPDRSDACPFVDHRATRARLLVRQWDYWRGALPARLDTIARSSSLALQAHHRDHQQTLNLTRPDR